MTDRGRARENSFGPGRAGIGGMKICGRIRIRIANSGICRRRTVAWLSRDSHIPSVDRVSHVTCDCERISGGLCFHRRTEMRILRAFGVVERLVWSAPLQSPEPLDRRDRGR